MKKAIISIILLLTFMTTWADLSNAETKVIDLNNWEHRFAIILATSPAEYIGLEPVPKEHQTQAITICLRKSVLEQSPGILLPVAGGYKVHQTPDGPVGKFGLICMSSPEELTLKDNLGWKQICQVFNMEFVKKPSVTSVLCQKSITNGAQI